MVCSCSSVTVSPADPCGDSQAGVLQPEHRCGSGGSSLGSTSGILSVSSSSPPCSGQMLMRQSKSHGGHQEGWGKERRACRRGGSGGFTQHREEKAEGV